MKEEEIYEMILNEDVEKYPLLNEIFAIRDNRHKVNNYTICVNGYISLDVINKAIKLQKENEELKADNYELNNRINDLLDNISVQKVKDKIEEEKLPLTIVGGRKNKKTLEYGIKLGRRQALQELIEEREEK